MIGQWAFSPATKQVPDLDTEPCRIRFRLAVETLTAPALIVDGLSVLMRSSWGARFYLTAAGMLLCSVIISLGHFAQKGRLCPGESVCSLADICLCQRRPDALGVFLIEPLCASLKGHPCT
jgi:hypothetical protein